jgi:hypothetical protein
MARAAAGPDLAEPRYRIFFEAVCKDWTSFAMS